MSKNQLFAKTWSGKPRHASPESVAQFEFLRLKPSIQNGVSVLFAKCWVQIPSLRRLRPPYRLLPISHPHISNWA